MSRTVFIALLFFSNFCNADVVNRWNCLDHKDYSSKEVILVAEINEKESSGNIILKMLGIKYMDIVQARQGFNQVWEFKDNAGRYKFVLSSTGLAAYFDFGKNDNKILPERLFKCKKVN